MIFFLLLQIHIDTVATPDQLLYAREVNRVRDSIYSSVDTTETDWEWKLNNRFREALWNNEIIRNHAIKNYVEKGEQVFFLPYFQSPIWWELREKRIEYLNSKKIEAVTDPFFKEKLKEYYRYKLDFTTVWYEEIPEDIAVDEDFIFTSPSIPFCTGGFQWFNKIGKKWFTNTLKTFDDSLFAALYPKDSLFIGYFSLLQSHTDTTASLFFLSRDSLRQIPSDSFYYIYHYSLEENTWVVGFQYNREKELWRAEPISLPLYFDLNHPSNVFKMCSNFYIVKKNSKVFSFLSKSLSKIEEIANIDSDSRVGVGDYFVWWTTDKFSGHSYEKIKVRVFFIENMVWTELPRGSVLNDIITCPEKEFLSKALRRLEDKKIKNKNNKENISEGKVPDSVTVYCTLPWVDKPEIKLVDGICFLVKPAK